MSSLGGLSVNRSVCDNSYKCISANPVDINSEKITDYARYFFTVVVSLTLLKYFSYNICLYKVNSCNEFCKNFINDLDCAAVNLDKNIMCTISQAIEKFGILRSALGLASIYIAGDVLMNRIKNTKISSP